MADRLLFLSHAGVDSTAALALAERIEQAGVKVWIDKRDLVAGRGWQQQLEGIIEHKSTGFAVYVGSRGVVNWVDSEVRVGLSRATREPGYPFIPILAKGVDPEALPAFAREFQGVQDVERDPEAMQMLLRAARGEAGRARLTLESQPFLGLSAFDEAHTHLFFGRERESSELVERLQKTNLLLLVGASGSGKSSLVKAGLIPRFRGGALAPTAGDRPDETPWHVVQTRPQAQPFERLVDAVSVAARAVGIDAETRFVLAKEIRKRDPDAIRDAIREGAPPRANTLLVVDQFEELWTQTGESDRVCFVDALLRLAAPGDFTHRVVVTMRHDYYNLCSQLPGFFARVNARDAPERYQLRRMTDDALRDCIVEPLSLTDAGDVSVFANAVLGDVGDQPGELALLEMALTEAWRRRRESGGNLLEAYERAGRVSGALANAAEEVFDQLPEADRSLAQVLFMRLVRLGDTGGTTRRVVARHELRADAWMLAQRLADETHKRLVLVTEDTVELAHEALVTQWPRYQNWLQPAAADKRRLDALMDDAARWAGAAEADRHTFVARGFDLDSYVQLARSDTRAAWLSDVEAAYVSASVEAEERQQQQYADLYRKALGRQLASQAMRLLDEPRCRNLELAILLAVEAHRRHPSLDAQQALFRGIERLPQRDTQVTVAVAERHILMVASSSGRYAAAGDRGPSIAICDLWQGRVLCHLQFPGGRIAACAFSDDERHFAAVGNHTVRLWPLGSEVPIGELDAAPDRPGRLLFAPAGDLLAVMNQYGHRVRIHAVSTLATVAELEMGTSKSPDMAFSPDGALFAALDETTATVWETSGWAKTQAIHSSRNVKVLFSSAADILMLATSATIEGWTIASGERAFSAGWQTAFSDLVYDGGSRRLAVAAIDGRLRICSTEPFAERQRLQGHGTLAEVGFDRRRRRCVAFEPPDVVRIWDLESGTEVERYRVAGASGRVPLRFDDGGLGIITATATGDSLTVSRSRGLPRSCRLKVESHHDLLGHVAIDAAGQRIAYCDEGVRVLSVESGTLARHQPGQFEALAFDPRGEFLCATRDDLFDSGLTLITLHGEGHVDVTCEGTAVYSRVRWSPGGAYFGVNRVPDSVTVWRRGLDRSIEFPHPRFPREWEFLCGERLMATLDDGPVVRIWEIEEGREVASLNLTGRSAGHLSCHPSEPLVVASGANSEEATIWDFANDRVVGRCAHPRGVSAHAVSPCGRWLATIGRDHAARLWRLPDGAPAHQLPHDDRVNSCAFSSDGAWLATAGADRTIRIWSTVTGRQAAQINRHEPVSWTGFLAGDAWLVVRHGYTAEILAWRVDDLAAIAELGLQRNLSRAEWQTYMEDEPVLANVSRAADSAGGVTDGARSGITRTGSWLAQRPASPPSPRVPAGRPGSA